MIKSESGIREITSASGASEISFALAQTKWRLRDNTRASRVKVAPRRASSDTKATKMRSDSAKPNKDLFRFNANVNPPTIESDKVSLR